MPKLIRQNEEGIYLAPKILGKHIDNSYIAIDEKYENIRLNPDNLDDKILIYERQVNGWFLDRATKIVKSDDTAFVVLMICASYIEGVEQYKQGTNSDGRSKRVFVQSVQSIYPNENFSDNDIGNLYSALRCGLFHSGMVDGRIIVDNNFNSSLNFGGDYIGINPEKLLLDIKKDFKNYISRLKDRNEQTLRENFDRMFSVTRIINI